MTRHPPGPCPLCGGPVVVQTSVHAPAGEVRAGLAVDAVGPVVVPGERPAAEPLRTVWLARKYASQAMTALRTKHSAEGAKIAASQRAMLAEVEIAGALHLLDEVLP